jgi:hypothetical protein
MTLLYPRISVHPLYTVLSPRDLTGPNWSFPAGPDPRTGASRKATALGSEGIDIRSEALFKYLETPRLHIAGYYSLFSRLSNSIELCFVPFRPFVLAESRYECPSRFFSPQSGPPPHCGQSPTLAAQFELRGLGPSILNDTAPRRDMGIRRIGPDGYV